MAICSSSLFQVEESSSSNTMASPKDPPVYVCDINETLRSDLHFPVRKQVTEQRDTTSNEDEDESYRLYDQANSILEECKHAAPLSDLDVAIHQFQEALDRRPTPHPLRSGSLKDLAGALVIKFSMTKQHEDLDQSLLLRGKVPHHEAHSVLVQTGEEFRIDVRVLFDPRSKAEIHIHHPHRKMLIMNTIVWSLLAVTMKCST
jgi:hypothetical protein